MQAEEAVGLSALGHPRPQGGICGKALAPKVRRKAIGKMMEQFELSERRARRLVSLSTDSFRNPPMASEQIQALR